MTASPSELKKAEEILADLSRHDSGYPDDDLEERQRIVCEALRLQTKEVLNSPEVQTVVDLLNERHGERCMHNGKPFPCEVCDALASFQRFREENSK